MVENRNSFAAKQVVELIRSLNDFQRDNYKRAALEQATPDFPNGKIKRTGMNDRPNITGTKTKLVPGRDKEVDHSFVIDLNTLGTACRTGSVNHIGEVLGCNRAKQILRSG